MYFDAFLYKSVLLYVFFFILLQNIKNFFRVCNLN